MSISIKSGTSTKEANVDNNVSGVTIITPTVLNQAGYAIAVGEVDSGSVYSSKVIRPLDVTQDFRLRLGIDRISWQDTFNHNTLNSSKYFATASTQTIVLSGGSLNLNGGNDGTSGSLSRIQTYKNFSLFSSYPLYGDFQVRTTGEIQANNVIEFGFGIVTGDTTSPSDGAFFRFTNVVSGVIVNNGLETSVSNIFTPSSGISNHYLVVLGIDSAEFWVDDVLRTIITSPVTTGCTVGSNSLPLLLRNYNVGAVSSPVQFNVMQVGVTIGDMDSGKDWPTTMVTNGQSSISLPDGQTPGQSTNNINNSSPYSKLLVPGIDFTNTYTSGSTLGGQFIFSGVTGSETDYILFAYLNPTSTAAIPGKNLIIRGIQINTYVSGATTAAAPTLLQWGLGIGSTSLSLLTTDSATSGTRAARRINLGIQSIASSKVVGSPADREISFDFDTPIIVEPGTYCHVILKIPVCTSVSSGSFRGTVLINGYYD